jgi:hypothetical protein
LIAFGAVLIVLARATLTLRRLQDPRALSAPWGGPFLENTRRQWLALNHLPNWTRSEGLPGSPLDVFHPGTVIHDYSFTPPIEAAVFAPNASDLATPFH